MISDKAADDVLEYARSLFAEANVTRSIIILLLSILLAYWVSRFVTRGIIRIAQTISARGENETDDERVLRWRQIETYLSITVAVIRVITVVVVAYVAWMVFSPTAQANSSLAAIGAGTIFVVVAGQTAGVFLRDITFGFIMIAERWFTVGDFIKVEPFMDVSGVVERFTLRGTKIRSLSGEIIWVHNQQISAVHVTPNALRTMAVDVFVRDRREGEKVIERVINSVPTGPTMLARPLRIKYAEKWGDDLWRIVVVGQTPPGREWLIQDFFINAIKAVDEGKKPDERNFVHPPIARFADSIADRRFKRAIRVKKNG